MFYPIWSSALQGSRALWLRSNKALRHELIINRITQVFELSTCSAAVLGSQWGTQRSGHMGRSSRRVSCPGWVCRGCLRQPLQSRVQKGHGCKCHQPEFFCCLQLGLVVRLSLCQPQRLQQGRQMVIMSRALREDVSTLLQPAPWAYHQLSPCPENTQFIIANEQILGPWTARYEQVDLSFSLN